MSTQWSGAVAIIVLTQWSGTVAIIVCWVVFCSILLSIVPTQWSGAVATIVLTHWSGTVVIIVCSVVFCSTILSAVSTPWSGTVATLVFWVDFLIHSSSGCCLIVGSLWNVSVCFLWVCVDCLDDCFACLLLAYNRLV